MYEVFKMLREGGVTLSADMFEALKMFMRGGEGGRGVKSGNLLSE